MIAQQVSIEEIAKYTGVRPILLQRLLELGLIKPQLYYTAVERRQFQLRRACRLIDDVGFEAETVEVLLRLRRRILTLQQQVALLQAELRRRPVQEPSTDWLEAE
jgi:hypothetical protein